uniref:tryptophan synthase alpha subunit n=1 Tax=Madagascaria erythrocladioides TaxID=753684 RepID=UPI001BEFCE1E|nr:tryptophan synthase alpha subunit [Madagascaria erythrocladioides]QUE28951.1 trpA [Madagascaria erythrocladioides]UNJ16502.1 tryptophan synthase alpha subunit [Madagascaria erythrocladioides]
MTLSVSDIFRKLNEKNKCALVPFITAGDPNLKITEKILKILDKEGASIIELGLPYSDSLADGPIIQEAAARALSRGIKFDNVLHMVQNVAQDISSPIVIFTYYNLILTKGTENFVQVINKSGAKGLIVPDLPLEESEELLSLCSKNGIELILLISPTSSLERIELIAKKAQGCLYIVASTGVTGIRSDLNLEIKNLIKTVKRITDKPIIIGFGISNPSQVIQVKSWGVDGIVLGSAFVNKIANFNAETTLVELTSFCKEIKQAIDFVQ